MTRLLRLLRRRATRPASQVVLVCDFCRSQRTSSLDAEEVAEVRELGFLPCSCGGAAIPL